jgi:hypothetical protein
MKKLIVTIIIIFCLSSVSAQNYIIEKRYFTNTPLTTIGNISGYGVTGKIAYWFNATSLRNTSYNISQVCTVANGLCNQTFTADGTGGWINTSTKTTTGLLVGIGDTTPSAKLEVNNNNNSVPALKTKYVSTATEGRVFVDAGGGAIDNPNAALLVSKGASVTDSYGIQTNMVTNTGGITTAAMYGVSSNGASSVSNGINYGLWFYVQNYAVGTASTALNNAVYGIARHGSPNGLTLNYAFSGYNLLDANSGLVNYDDVYVASSNVGANTQAVYHRDFLASAPYVSTGATMNYRYGLYVADANNYGTMTTQYGVYLENINAASANYAIYSEGGANVLKSGGATTIPLTVQGAVAQAANLFVIKNSVGSEVVYVEPSGALTSTSTITGTNFAVGSQVYWQGKTVLGSPTNGRFAISNYAETNKVIIDTVDNRFNIDRGESITVPNATTVGLVVKGSASQTANLQVWKKSDGTDYAYINGTGILYADVPFGEMYSYNMTGWTLDFVTEEVYANFTNMSAGDLQGFTFTSNKTLNCVKEGMYAVNFGVSFSGTTGSTHGIGLGVNGTIIRECYTQRKLGSNDVGNTGGTCIISLGAGDKVTLMADDEDSTVNDIQVMTANVNLVRIG